MTLPPQLISISLPQFPDLRNMGFELTRKFASSVPAWRDPRPLKGICTCWAQPASSSPCLCFNQKTPLSYVSALTAQFRFQKGFESHSTRNSVKALSICISGDQMKKRKQPGSTKDGTTPLAGLDPRAAGQRGGLRPVGWDAGKLAGLRVEDRHGDSREIGPTGCWRSKRI